MSLDDIMSQMMHAHVLKGTRQEIAEGLARISGEVREAIVFVDESPRASSEACSADTKDIFAEMTPFMVDVRDANDSREAIYSLMDGE